PFESAGYEDCCCRYQRGTVRIPLTEIDPQATQRRALIKGKRHTMEMMFDLISPRTFWRILLFIHFTLGVALLWTVTLQAVAVWMPVREAAGRFIARFPAVPTTAFATPVVALYVAQLLMGMWIYTKYRIYVRIPMEQLGHWWIVGGFDGKEHAVAIGMALLPAYWYFWRHPLKSEDSGMRKGLTVLLALIVWYAFINGHIANDFRGVGS